jgi:hypothetical protein
MRLIKLKGYKMNSELIGILKLLLLHEPNLDSRLNLLTEIGLTSQNDGKKKKSEMEKQCCCDEDVGYICCVCHEAKIKELEEMNKAQRIYFDENINLKEKLKVAVEYIVKQDCEWHRNGPCDHCEILEKIHTNERIK